MSDSIMKQADEIMGGMLAQKIPDSIGSPTIDEAGIPRDLPDISDDQRNSFLAESVVGEKLGSELRPHAKTGETAISPGHTEKHTSVSPSPGAQKSLSPQAKSKLQRHKGRESSRSDKKTSWAVDSPQPQQKKKWSAESGRQEKHTAARGQSTRGSESKPASKGIGTMRPRKGKLTPAHQTQMAKKAPGHIQKRHDQANAARQSGRLQTSGLRNTNKNRITLVEKGKKGDKWIQGAEADINRRGTEGKCTPITKPGCTGKAKALAKTFKKMAKKRGKDIKAKDESLTREQVGTLKRALTILKEVTSAGGIGTTQGANMHGSANRAYDADAKPMGKDTPKIVPVDKSLRKVSKALKAKRAAKNKKVKKEAFERFLNRILSDAQTRKITQGGQMEKVATKKPINPSQPVVKRKIGEAKKRKPDTDTYRKTAGRGPGGVSDADSKPRRISRPGHPSTDPREPHQRRRAGLSVKSGSVGSDEWVQSGGSQRQAKHAERMKDVEVKRDRRATKKKVVQHAQDTVRSAYGKEGGAS